MTDFTCHWDPELGFGACFQTGPVIHNATIFNTFFLKSFASFSSLQLVKLLIDLVIQFLGRFRDEHETFGVKGILPLAPKVSCLFYSQWSYLINK